MQQIKEIRQHLDHLMIQTKNYPNNREVASAYTNTQRCSMWLGQVLAAQKEPNPYPNSTDISNEKIEPRADQSKDSPATFEGMPPKNQTIQVKWFRLQLEGLISRLKALTLTDGGHEATIAIDALIEAKMWWGWELNNIFNQQKKEE